MTIITRKQYGENNEDIKLQDNEPNSENTHTHIHTQYTYIQTCLNNNHTNTHKTEKLNENQTVVNWLNANKSDSSIDF